MFTGLVEEIGTVKRLSRTAAGGQLVITAPSLHEKVLVKDSVAVNGACLTVVSRTGRDCAFTMSRATLETTNLGRLKAGGKVNLELPLTAEGRLGGHYVLGHIDTLGTLSEIKEAGNASAAAITVPEGFEKYLVEKGSIAVDGVSLTVASIEKNNFTAVILPLTFQSTIFQYARAGDRVNLEGDILAKYIFKYLETYQGLKTGRGGIDESFLKKHGYL